MRQFYKCKHFTIRELVDEATYEKYGESAWMFFNPVMLRTLDNIREYFNKPITVNNWSFGGELDSRGLRSPTDDTGSKWVFHYKGSGVDFSIQGMTADDVRAEIIRHQFEPPFDDITAMEINITWVHIDFRNVDTPNNKILLFKG